MAALFAPVFCFLPGPAQSPIFAPARALCFLGHIFLLDQNDLSPPAGGQLQPGARPTGHTKRARACGRMQHARSSTARCCLRSAFCCIGFSLGHFEVNFQLLTPRVGPGARAHAGGGVRKILKIFCNMPNNSLHSRLWVTWVVWPSEKNRTGLNCAHGIQKSSTHCQRDQSNRRRVGEDLPRCLLGIEGRLSCIGSRNASCGVQPTERA